MRLFDKYLVTSSVTAIFTEAFNFHYFIDWKLFYVILISNFLLLAYKCKLTVHKNLIVIISFFIFHGVINFLLFLNPIQSLIAQILGVSISSIYFFNLIRVYKVKILIEKYLEIAFLISIASIPMFYLGINVFSSDRLNGVLTEPAHYAAIMLPAVYLLYLKKKYLKLVIVLFTIFLTKSSVGYIGLLIMIIIPLLQLKNFLKYSIVVITVLVLSGLYLSSKWSEKVDENKSNKIVRRLKQTKESLSASFTGKFKKNTNLSSYAFLSNFFITKEILIHKPFGAGLGAYRHEYEKYYKELKPPKYLITLNQSKINKTDANSLFLRMIADFGVFSLLFFFYFFYRVFIVFKKENKVNEQSTFFYLFVKLIREGHYFPPEFYFFLLIFLKNSDEDITYC